jgi:predicted kinase
MMKVYIMRGLPGSGKSTWLKKFAQDHIKILAADDYHLTNGEYRFDPARSAEAHQWCFRSFVLSVVASVKRLAPNEFSESLPSDHQFNIIAVDNTNTTIVEMAPYVRLCEAFGVEYEVVYHYCTLEESHAWNVHAVPLPVLLTMSRNLLTEVYPSYWKSQKILTRKEKE